MRKTPIQKKIDEILKRYCLDLYGDSYLTKLDIINQILREQNTTIKIYEEKLRCITTISRSTRRKTLKEVLEENKNE